VHRCQPDVVVAHGGDAFKYVALATRRPIVYCAIGTLPGAARSGPRLYLWRALARRAARIAAVSDDVAAECRTVLHVPAARVVVVPNGRDPSRYHPGAAPGGDTTQLLFVGRLTPGKRPDWFVETVRLLRDEGLPVAGRIVGDGPLRSSLADAVAGAGVEMDGWCPDVVPRFHESDLLVFPSAPDGEGMPGVLIEAGLCGVPVVTTDVPGATAVVDDGVTGAVVPVDDFGALVRAVRDLVQDPGRRRAMGAAARVVCERDFSMSAIAARWDALAREVAAGSGGRAIPRTRPAAAGAGR
jgi:glycosyltransferase involved in cell wall biosynthesis